LKEVKKVSKFPKPTNVFIEEDITIKGFVPEETEKGLKFSVKDIPAKQKTMYVDSPIKKIICARGEHNWRVIDKRNYIFACSNCKLKRKVYPVTYRFEKGQLIHKETSEII
jgi:hypothetical protein